MKKITGWLAILAMALNALWPLIAQARPPLLVPVCTVGGDTHYVELPGGTTPVDSQHEHCTFCFAGAALPATHVRHGVDAQPRVSPKAVSFTPRSFIVVSADARAPPVFPLARFDNQHGRTNEKAFALRAARADLGGSVVRIGILLG
jgi:hypothetical protein